MLLLVLSGCSAGTDVEPRSLPTVSDSVSTPTSVAATTTTAPSATTTSLPSSPLSAVVSPIGSALHEPSDRLPVSVPVALTIDTIGVDSAPVIPVGVLDNGEMEIPGRTEVGWYKFGPGPGNEGSAVLAAHIAFDNRAGVFRRLASMELEDSFVVEFEDGTTQSFEVFEIAQYDKEEVPFQRVFAKVGDPVVVLITCGGVFDRSIGSYEDNIVVYGRPISG